LPPSLADLRADKKPLANVNDQHAESLTKLNKLALFITDHVGTMGFFLIIFTWTVVWTGYNILATEVPALHWPSFDPFPAFVAYLLISNVVQILLMPLIMVGQNLQSAHSELRAQNDFEINCKAEMEVEAILKHLEYQNSMLLALLEKQGIRQEQILSAMKATGTSAPEA